MRIIPRIPEEAVNLPVKGNQRALDWRQNSHLRFEKSIILPKGLRVVKIDGLLNREIEAPLSRIGSFGSDCCKEMNKSRGKQVTCKQMNIHQENNAATTYRNESQRLTAHIFRDLSSQSAQKAEEGIGYCCGGSIVIELSSRGVLMKFGGCWSHLKLLMEQVKFNGMDMVNGDRRWSAGTAGDQELKTLPRMPLRMGDIECLWELVGLEQDKDSTRIKEQKSRGYRIKRIKDYQKKRRRRRRSRAVEQDRGAENSG
ncbi:hypothetical protein PPACK8108_LOCUS21542, partial [Phakopsora pachyrhizi]